MKRTDVIVATLVAAMYVTEGVGAAVIENFDSPTGTNGQVLFQADPIYLATGASPSGGDKNGNSPYLNGYILQNNNFTPFNNPGTWGVISHDQGGTGSFLWEGTNTGSAASYAGKLWESLTAAPVSPNTTYDFSFYLVNSNNQGNYAIIHPTINGVSLGAGVSAVGFMTDGNSAHGWQQFHFTWNSGSATTADMALFNQPASNSPGDDFGVDTIALTAVPEPSSIVLLGTCVALGGLRRRKANQAKTRALRE